MLESSETRNQVAAVFTRHFKITYQNVRGGDTYSFARLGGRRGGDDLGPITGQGCGKQLDRTRFVVDYQNTQTLQGRGPDRWTVVARALRACRCISHERKQKSEDSYLSLACAMRSLCRGLKL